MIYKGSSGLLASSHENIVVLVYRDENSPPFSISKIGWWTPKWRKAIFKSLIKGLKSENINIETSQFMLNLYLKFSLTSFKNKLQQKSTGII